MQRVAYHRLAANELLSSARRYDRQVPGLGDDFVSAVDETILKLRKNLELGRMEVDGVRSWKTRRFPYR